MPRKTIAVAGATGNQGGSVARYLLQHQDSYHVRALTRNPESAQARELATRGAEVVRTDFTDASTLKSALKGCWGVFGVTNFYDQQVRRLLTAAYVDDDFEQKTKDDPASEEQQGKNLAKAAHDAGVQRYIWSTLPSSENLSDGKRISQIYEGKYRVDDYIRSLGLPAIFLHTGTFYENMVLRGHVRYDHDQDTIEFRQPIIRPDTKPMVYVGRDLPLIVNAIFTQWASQSHRLDHTYLLASDARWSPAEVVQTIERITGKKTIYTVLPSTGWPDRDTMFELYNDIKISYPGREVPDPKVTGAIEDGGLGVNLSGGLEEYIRLELLPALGLTPNS